MKFRSFSYNELLIVVAIAGILLLMSAPFYLKFMNSSHVAYTSDILIRYLRSAQNKSMNVEDGVEWGVCYRDNSILIYKSACQPSNYVHTYFIGPELSIIGLDAILFQKEFGGVSGVYNITISKGNISKTVTVNSIGGYDIQ